MSPPEFLLRARLIQILYTERSEHPLVEHISYNQLVLWFVGLGVKERTWDNSSFSQNRRRLYARGMARQVFERVTLLAEWQDPISDEHSSVDGTRIEAWTSHKGYRAKGA